ncbi:hypothetical protein ACWEWX_11300 [Streptomyces asiaticus]
MTAEQELPGVDEYAVRLETARCASTWPGIPQPGDATPGPPRQLELPRAVDAPPLDT